MRAAIPYVIVLLALAGCSSASISPNRQIVKQFDKVDSLQAGDVVISDRETIDRFQEIYKRAKWRPYIATFPANTTLITAKSADDDLFHLSCWGGILLESSGNGYVRQGTMKEDDEQWMRDNIIEFAQSSENEN